MSSPNPTDEGRVEARSRLEKVKSHHETYQIFVVRAPARGHQARPHLGSREYVLLLIVGLAVRRICARKK